MIQIATYTSESRLNEWLEKVAGRIAVRDIKFSSDGPHACRFLVIYETDTPAWMELPSFNNNKQNNIEFNDYNVALNG